MDDRTEEGGLPDTTPAENPDQSESEGIAQALARVQEAVTDVTNGELRESLEAAIETIDSTHTGSFAEHDKLATVADALEGALDELERGKVANLLPVIEQAQSIVEPGSSGL